MLNKVLQIVRKQISGIANLMAAAVCLVAAYVVFALSLWYANSLVGADRDLPQSASIFRLEQISGAPGAPNDWIDGSALPLAELWDTSGLPVTHSTRFFPASASVANGEVLLDVKAAFVDASFVNVFGLTTISGSLSDALSKPDTSALDSRTAMMLFRTVDVVGKTVKINGHLTSVSAVVHSRQATSIPFGVLTNIKSPAMPEPWRLDFWYGTVGQNYVKVSSTFDSAVAAERLERYYKTTAAFEGLPPNLKYSTKPYFKPRFVGLRDLPLKGAGSEARGRLLWAMLSAAVLVLLLAAANLLHSVVRSVQSHQRELGIRKMLGASPKWIAFDIFRKTVFVSVASALVGIAIAAFLIPSVSARFGSYVVTGSLDLFTISLVVIASIAVGVLVSLYPGLLAAKLRCGDALQGRGNQESGAIRTMRRFTSIAQVTLAATLIATSCVLVMQARLAANADPGYDTSRLAVLDVPTDLKDPRTLIFIDALKRLPAVTEVGISRDMPGRRRHYGSVTMALGADRPVAAALELVGPGYFETYRIAATAGRTLDVARGDAQNSAEPVVVNQKAVRSLGFASDNSAVGRIILADGRARQIVGVVSDVRLQGLREQARPTMFSMTSPFVRAIAVRWVGDQNVLASFSEVWKSHYPSYVPRVSLASTELAALYSTESKMADFVSVAALIGTIIAAVGLHSLAASSVALRLAEVQLLKLFGATPTQIVWLLSRGTLAVALVGTICGVAAASWATASYLASFMESVRIWPFPVLMSFSVVLMVTICSLAASLVVGLRQRPSRLLTA